MLLPVKTSQFADFGPLRLHGDEGVARRAGAEDDGPSWQSVQWISRDVMLMVLSFAGGA